MWNRESDDATLPELSPCGIALSRKPPVQTWLCVEFQIDSQTREIHTWVDGQVVAGLAVEGDGTPEVDAQWLRNTNWQPKPQNLKLGWESYGSDANTVWFDEVALGPRRIGCEP